ncbi:MAG: tRNA (adenosine(37)-N6)-threonylcarbamoyltransferase complex ATPase subunit type 1 TsaE [Candidatus Moranbacteria bacterium]|nr:tRNA (adenosine(37)-N6)-threonylcarbamoyltransferase complex ATPase subunit type 1 TsaE [Candidatus Moranbacteria bacterium]
MDTFFTSDTEQTRKLGEMLAKELCGGPARNASLASASSRSDAGGEVICLTGELGSGKTTFAQGVLRGLGVKGPWTSPTFLVVKHYKKEIPNPKSQIPNKSKISKSKIQNIYHIDCYRVKAQDILDLGWKEIIAGKNNIVIVEWAKRIRKIIPEKSIWVSFEHVNKNKRKIFIGNEVIGSGTGH